MIQPEPSPPGVDGGRQFRSFLLGTLKHDLSDERKRAQALKRGGSHQTISIDEISAESQYQLEAVDHLTPDRLFDRKWGPTVIRRVLKGLRDRYAARQRVEIFDLLQPTLGGSETTLAFATIIAYDFDSPQLAPLKLFRAPYRSEIGAAGGRRGAEHPEREESAAPNP